MASRSSPFSRNRPERRHEDFVRRDIDEREARRVAQSFGVRMPRVGYEVSLGNGAWLSSNGHFQFGFFEKPEDTKLFHVRCRHDPCPETCPATGGS